LLAALAIYKTVTYATAQGGNGGISPEGQLRFAADEYDQSFSGVGGGGRIGPHRIMSIDVNQSGPITLADPLGGQGRISSGFVRRDGSYHGGLDIGAPEGTPIYAAESGVVSYAGPGTGYGRYIDIQHFGYDVVTRYGHVRGFAPGIGPGSAVGKGELVAYVGNVGRSSGPHLHFEVVVGDREWVDPRPFLRGR